MSRLTPENVQRARETIALYPHARSALIPLCHLAQEQDGWLAPDAVEHIAELLDLEPAEVQGTASFYEMFKRHPVGRYLVNVCTNISCMLLGGYELVGALEKHLGVAAGATTADGEFTLEEVECVAACTQAPCLLVNYRVFGPLDGAEAATLMDDLRAGKLEDTVPPHGVTNRVRRRVAATAAPAKAGHVEHDVPGPQPESPPERHDTSPTREIDH